MTTNGGRTLSELAELAKQDTTSMSDRALLRLTLAVSTETYYRVRQLEEQVTEQKEYPSLLWLIRHQPKKTITVVLIILVLMEIIFEFNLISELFRYIGLL